MAHVGLAGLPGLRLEDRALLCDRYLVGVLHARGHGRQGPEPLLEVGDLVPGDVRVEPDHVDVGVLPSEHRDELLDEVRRPAAPRAVQARGDEGLPVQPRDFLDLFACFLKLPFQRP